CSALVEPTTRDLSSRSCVTSAIGIRRLQRNCNTPESTTGPKHLYRSACAQRCQEKRTKAFHGSSAGWNLPSLKENGTMATIITTVRLDRTKNALDVEDHGAPIQVPGGTSATSLVWQLSGNAAQGSFNALDAANPGFKWVGTPPPANIFSAPSRSTNGNEIS